MLANVLVSVKPFDIDLNWMSKFRNQEKAAFWMADDDDGMIRYTQQDPNNACSQKFLITNTSIQNAQKCSKKPAAAAA
jgi:hypothetical protein